MLSTSYLRNPANWIIAIAVLIIGINGVLFRGSELDDALIYARYLQNLISGNGFVYNPGEFVNGLTSPLFAYLSLLPAIVTGDARFGIMTVSVLANLGTAIAFYRILILLISDRQIAAMSSLLAALASITYFNLGMEASLFTFMVAICLYLYLNDQHFLLGISIGLAVLTRPEAVLLVPAMAMNTLLFRRPWPAVSCYVAPAILVLAQLLFNSVYYGNLLPTSGLAKVAQGASGIWGHKNYLLTLLARFDSGFRLSGSWLVMGVILGLAGFSLAVKPARQYMVVTLSFLLLYTGFFAVLNIPAQAWYYAIYFALLWTYAVLGAYWLANRFMVAHIRQVRIGLLSLFAVLLVWQEPRHLADFGRTVREDYKAFGLWLADNTAPGASVALVEIGTVGWYSNRRIIDILGLVTSDNAAFVADGDFTSWLAFNPPDYILVHDPPRQPYEAVIRYLQNEAPDTLAEVMQFRFPGYKLYAYRGELF